MASLSHEQINRRLDDFGVSLRITLEGIPLIAALGGLAAIAALTSLMVFVLNSHAGGYRSAGVPEGQAIVGAIVAQVLVAAVTVAAVLLFRTGYPRASRAVGVVAAALLLLFAILPNVVGGSSWLTTFLAVLTALLLHALVGFVAGVATVLAR